MDKYIFEDPIMKNLIQTIDRIAVSRSSVLLQGETGTGKEVLAKYIHEHSLRKSNRFATISCAAIPEGLLESELFGYEKGAFTGAIKNKIGKLELAHGGTFLLDEISELPLSLQSKLLRVIQEKEIERLGSLKLHHIDLRIIATSNRDLKEMVDKGQFRQDLFYRLNVVSIFIPPLRRRTKDIIPLSQLFIKEACKENNIDTKSLSVEAERELILYSWPGNVRELKNIIESAVLFSENQIIQKSDLKFVRNEELKLYEYNKITDEYIKIKDDLTIEALEKKHILKILEISKYNKRMAASLLGISIRTLRNKLNQYRRESHESVI